jgi:hypothetical protein
MATARWAKVKAERAREAEVAQAVSVAEAVSGAAAAEPVEVPAGERPAQAIPVDAKGAAKAPSRPGRLAGSGTRPPGAKGASQTEWQESLARWFVYGAGAYVALRTAPTDLDDEEVSALLPTRDESTMITAPWATLIARTEFNRSYGRAAMGLDDGILSLVAMATWQARITRTVRERRTADPAASRRAAKKGATNERPAAHPVRADDTDSGRVVSLVGDPGPGGVVPGYPSVG